LRSGDEDLRASLLANLHDVGVLKQGSNLDKRGVRTHHGDEGCLLVEKLAEAGDEDVDELAIRGIA
jgi:hypothetical protein